MSYVTRRSLAISMLGLHLVLVLVRPINDPDLWWHLRNGQEIVRAHSIPRSDTYSFTAFGKPWVAHEWLSDITMYAIYYLSGWTGLVLVLALMSAAVFLFVAYYCKAGLPVVILAVLISNAAALVVLREPRPRLGTLILSATFFIILRNYVIVGKSRAVWWLPILMAIWVNLHAGYPLGFIFLAISVITLSVSENRQHAKYLGTIVGLCLIAVLLNPHGARMFFYPFETQFSAAQMSLINEWLAPNFKDPQTLPFLVLILVVIVVLGVSRKRISAFDLLCLITGLVMALRSYRHVSVLSIVAIPVLAEHAWDWISPENRAVRILERFVPILLVVVVIFGDLGGVYRTIKEPVNLSDDPVAATQFLEEKKLPDNVFSKYEWNDYLIWNAPSRKVFIDGRADMYGDEFLAEFFSLYTEGKDWEKTFRDAGVRTAMLEPASRLAVLIRQSGEWSEVYNDGKAVIFIRK